LTTDLTPPLRSTSAPCEQNDFAKFEEGERSRTRQRQFLKAYLTGNPHAACRVYPSTSRPSRWRRVDGLRTLVSPRYHLVAPSPRASRTGVFCGANHRVGILQCVNVGTVFRSTAERQRLW